VVSTTEGVQPGTSEGPTEGSGGEATTEGLEIIPA